MQAHLWKMYYGTSINTVYEVQNANNVAAQLSIRIQDKPQFRVNSFIPRPNSQHTHGIVNYCPVSPRRPNFVPQCFVSWHAFSTLVPPQGDQNEMKMR